MGLAREIRRLLKKKEVAVRKRRRKVFLEPLEPRILLDGLDPTVEIENNASAASISSSEARLLTGAEFGSEDLTVVDGGTVQANDSSLPSLTSTSLLSGQGFDFLGQIPPSYAVDAGPCSVTGPDLDRNGHVDLVTPNSWSDTVSVLRNRGDGTFDAGVPSSNVFSLPAMIEQSDFLVQWTGEDDTGGSGIGSYDIYVSMDGGSYALWKDDITETSATFTGTPGYTYAFYRTARDNVGNQELPLETADAQTTVSGGTGDIVGNKFEDKDGDGVKDAGELGLPVWTIFVDMNGDGFLENSEPRTVTGNDGSYSFTNLEAGTYTVAEVLQHGWIATTPASGSQNVSVVGGETATADFGNFRLGEIRGLKFHDLDADGTRDADEPTLAGWTIFVDMDGDGVLDEGEQSMVTGEDGAFAFTEIGPSQVMQLGEVAQGGWARTTTAVPHDVLSGFSVVEDMGNVELGSLSGVKFNDLDGDGERDQGEPGLPGWTIFLDSDGDGVLDKGENSVVTDENGAYTFTDLMPGQYILAEVQKPGWTQTSPTETAGPVGFPNISTSGSQAWIESLGCG